jgi:SAM-dependent methyltransferase
MSNMDKPQTTLDDQGLNVLDPKDTRGNKSHYITLIQELALIRYLPQGNGRQVAVDIGCGYGRLSSVLRRCGWQVIGVDPSMRLLKCAKELHGDLLLCQSGLPYLPFSLGSLDTVLLHNLMRSLLIMGKVHYAANVSGYLKPDGLLIVVDNIRSGRPDYFDEPTLVQFFESQGMEVTGRYPIRSGRWWVLYLIRYGFVPNSWHRRIAEYELSRRRHIRSFPSWQYMNVMYHFRKTAKKGLSAELS